MYGQHLPCYFFLAATVLLAVVTITSPVIHNWGFLLVNIPPDQAVINAQNRTVVFGALG
jgi:hypothetical protein